MCGGLDNPELCANCGNISTIEETGNKRDIATPGAFSLLAAPAVPMAYPGGIAPKWLRRDCAKAGKQKAPVFD
jgi:hypothetical protein